MGACPRHSRGPVGSQPSPARPQLALCWVAEGGAVFALNCHALRQWRFIFDCGVSRQRLLRMDGCVKKGRGSAETTDAGSRPPLHQGPRGVGR